MKNLILSILLMLASFGVMAEIEGCNTSFNGVIKSLKYDNSESELYENYSFREIFLSGWGNVTCPAFVTLRYLTPKLTDIERSLFCLNYEKDKKTYSGYAVGDRNAYLECKKPTKTFCDRINNSKNAALAISGVAAGSTVGGTVAAQMVGVTAVAHSSGALILTGAGGYIAGTLGSIGAGALAVLTAPVTLTAATVSVVAVGGAVYVCKE